MRIAIVDDIPTNLLIVEKILNDAGYYDVITFASAKGLLDYLCGNSDENGGGKADLILMDMMMPEIDGIEATRTIQANETLKDIPIIIVTAVGDSNKLAAALESGAIDYVTKPINKIELIARIRVALRLKIEKDRHQERDDKIRSELELAKQVQHSVLSIPIRDPYIEISAMYHPSAELAGDMYAWYRIDESRYAVILFDMLGHGISSSLVCMYIFSVLRDTITTLVDPVSVIRDLNRYMNQIQIQDQFMHYFFTAIYLVVDTETRKIEYVNAGHPPGLLLQEGKPPQCLEEGGSAIGIFPEMDIRKGTINYAGASEIILYTDGLMELVEEKQQMQQWIVGVNSRDEAQLAQEVASCLPENKEYQHDDVCLVRIIMK